MSCFSPSLQPLHYRHHEPSHIICPQPAASPQLQVHCCWYHSWLLDKLKDFQVLYFFLWNDVYLSLDIPVCSLIRWVLCANHMEPVKGFLGRYLRRKLIETEIGSRTRNMELVKIIDWIPRVWHHLNRFLEMHSSSDVTIGKRTMYR